ncbi:MAG: hypothetical protein ACXU86_20760, partial [Archangium sp.]
MSRHPLSRFLPLVLCLALWMPVRQAHAQKPQRSAPAQKSQHKAQHKGQAEKPQYDDPSMLEPEEMAVDPAQEITDDSSDERTDEDPKHHGRGKNRKDPGSEDAPAGSEAEQPAVQTEAPVPPPAPAPAQPAAPAPVVRPPPPNILTPRVTDADLQAAWDKWQKAVASLDMEAARKAQQELLSLKDEVAALDMEALSIGFLRAAEGRRKANDSAGALQLVQHAVSLSPNLPYARLALAEAYARRSPGDVGAWSREIKAAL